MGQDLHEQHKAIGFLAEIAIWTSFNADFWHFAHELLKIQIDGRIKDCATYIAQCSLQICSHFKDYLKSSVYLCCSKIRRFKINVYLDYDDSVGGDNLAQNSL